jgi:hypothetical protein
MAKHRNYDQLPISPPEQYKDGNKVLQWSQAELAVCLDDVRGLNSIMLNAKGHEVSVESGSDALNNKHSRVHAQADHYQQA